MSLRGAALLKDLRKVSENTLETRSWQSINTLLPSSLSVPAFFSMEPEAVSPSMLKVMLLGLASILTKGQISRVLTIFGNLAEILADLAEVGTRQDNLSLVLGVGDLEGVIVQVEQVQVELGFLGWGLESLETYLRLRI